MNNQKPTKRIKSDGLILNTHSIFYTLQGEGPFSGVPAVFIRLTGCNLQCPGCDTEYTNTRTYAGDMHIEDVLNQVLSISHDNPNVKLVVITGGEPFRQNIVPLIYTLQNQGYTVQIETNGTIAPQEDLPADTVVICSPKTSKINPLLSHYITAYKYVLDYNSVSKHDGLPLKALDNTATPCVARPHVGFEGDIYLSPADMREYYKGDILDNLRSRQASAIKEIEIIHHNDRNYQAVAKSCMQYNYIAQLQIHKLLNVE